MRKKRCEKAVVRDVIMGKTIQIDLTVAIINRRIWFQIFSVLLIFEIIAGVISLIYKLRILLPTGLVSSRDVFSKK